ncbi:hypothetical protein CNH03270 [Cryptococcus deneoformans JEC21]|uniref:Protein phosphatase n=1 Tax=Cryptococcus deneoformans (strain JEC21 / ATCC MYA-565) TaxID=214684 RepID=Q5KD47_CRYD1|nr:hypothetical protein CNH03270 [Cryptococcus neoformans var. neoformans JEC21]AAW45190.2 hypothetical protein CNH03270 [Cryptococcus neoformans var. neoformans JEC21]
MSKPKPGLGKGIGKGIARTLSVAHSTPDYALVPTWDPPEIVLAHPARLRHPPASTRLPIFRLSAIPRPYLSQPYSCPYPYSYSYSTLSTSPPPPAQPMPLSPDRVLYSYPSLPPSTSIDVLLSALEINSHTSYTSLFNSSSIALDSSPSSSSPSSSSSARPNILPVPYSPAGPRDPPSPRSTQQSLKSRSLNSLSSSLDSSSSAPPPPGHSSGGGGGGGVTFGAVIPPLATSDGGGLPSSSFIFHLGASGLAKDRPRTSSSSSSPARPSIPPRPRSFPLLSIPSPPSSALRSISIGEDSYFTRPDGLCIADGVGAWARSGRGKADAGRWSALMTHFCEEEVGNWWSGKDIYLRNPRGKGKGKGKERDKSSSVQSKESSGRGNDKSNVKGKGKSSAMEEEVTEGEKERRPLDPVEIMQRGYEKCLSCAISEGINGSSTCLLALLHNSTLHVANLGDCCLLLIRGGKVVFRTEEMQHAFNFPLQVGTHSRDEPMKDAMRFDVPVKKGDIVVVGSDGLMDNMFDEDILEVLSQLSPSPSPSPSPPPPQPVSSSPQSPSPTHTHTHTDTHTLTLNPQKASEALCTRARQISETTTTTTPFMCAAIEEGIDFVGGKKDDISVLVGVVGVRSLKEVSVKDGLEGVEEQGQAQGKEGGKERLMLYH